MNVKSQRTKSRNGKKWLDNKKLAEKLGIHPATLSNKINGKTEFTCDEIMKIGEILHLSQKRIAEIFLAINLRLSKKIIHYMQWIRGEKWM